jgi:hypothetical protein
MVVAALTGIGFASASHLAVLAPYTAPFGDCQSSRISVSV